MNPINFIKQFLEKGGNSNPMIVNLISMAKKGDVKGVTTFARNLYKDKGLDFDKEFSNFMSKVKR